MINPNKKRDPSPLVHLGLPQICGRYRDADPGEGKILEKEDRLAAARALIEAPQEVVPGELPVQDEAPAPKKRGRGRPALEGKPWEAEGLSRSAWYAKKKSSPSP